MIIFNYTDVYKKSETMQAWTHIFIVDIYLNKWYRRNVWSRKTEMVISFKIYLSNLCYIYNFKNIILYYILCVYIIQFMKYYIYI